MAVQRREVWYADDVFTINHRWLYNYAAELKRRNLKLPFETISRADRMMKDDWIVVQNPVPEAKFPEGQSGRWYTKLETGEQAAIAINDDKGKTMVVVGSMGVLDKSPKGAQ